MPRFADETIERDGVRLRPLTADDAEAIAEACQDAAIKQWLPLPEPYTLETARFFATQFAALSLDSGQGMERGIEVDGRLMGVIGLKQTNWMIPKTEIGYWLAPWGRGRGAMTTALCALTDWALDSQGMGRVEVLIAPGNAASLGVARRAQFIEEGVLRQAGWITSGPVDLVMLSRLPGDPRP